ncbi:MAG: AAA family ATPase, partial [Candidatus Bathyarchaeota archaeon]
MSNKLVIGVAGMPGAGKSTVVEVARKMGFGIVVMGDEIRKE